VGKVLVFIELVPPAAKSGRDAFIGFVLTNITRQCAPPGDWELLLPSLLFQDFVEQFGF
jgi:hypothetical protein